MRSPSARKLIVRAALAGAVAVAAITGYGLAATPNAAASTTYRAELRSLTGGAARGQAELRLAGNGKTLLVHITASGLEAGGDHISHIHGLSSGGQAVDSTCPTQAQDSDGDGFVELAEGQVTYGPILLDFMNIDPDKDGKIDFRKTVRLSGNEGATPLADRHIVIHGMSVGAVGAGTPGEVDGTAGYKTVLPVLCGEIQPAR